MPAVFEYAPVLKGESTMSLDIDQIALHQLIKRDENQLELVLRDLQREKQSLWPVYPRE